MSRNRPMHVHQLEAEKIELTEKRNSLQKDLVQSQKDLAVAKVCDGKVEYMICLWQVCVCSAMIAVFFA